ncbi:MAG TPA: desulfoferrodoxin family protein [Spirochaetia bacterium]|nr:desulfoferrodoxin family protein [Spirochaetia bacterium]
MKFGELIKGSDKEGKEKHVPTIEVEKCKDCGDLMVNIIVGKEVAHPNTVEHHIAWIQLYGVKDSGQVVHLLTAGLGPVVANPCAHICIKQEGLKSLIALEYCNIHGVWENSIDL